MGVKSARGSVVVYVTAAENDAQDRPPRVGVVTSKFIGGSVVRHRAARRIRAAIAPLMMRVPSGSRVVVRALPGADHDRHLASDLRLSLDRALERL